MITQQKFIKNYLTKEHYKYGVLVSLSILYLCLMASIVYWTPLSKMSKLLAANYELISVKGEYWRLFTTTFVHGDISHLLANSLMLYILMYFVTSFFGSFISVVVSLVVAMLTNYIVLRIYGGEIHLVGISGVVYYLWGFWMVLYLFLQRHYSVINRILRMGAVFLILLIPSEFQAQTSYLAHGVGFILGILVGFIYYLFNYKKLHKEEVWQTQYISEELTDLDEIALSYPKPE